MTNKEIKKAVKKYIALVPYREDEYLIDVYDNLTFREKLTFRKTRKLIPLTKLISYMKKKKIDKGIFISKNPFLQEWFQTQDIDSKFLV